MRPSQLSALLAALILSSTLPVRAQLPDMPEEGDEFGSALATGDFNGDGTLDLAIGVAEERIDTSPFWAGAVHVIYGGDGGLAEEGNQFWTQDDPTLEGEIDPDDNDLFGFALASGDFDADGYDDLAIGVPWDESGSLIVVVPNVGAVQVLYGSPEGLSGDGDQLWDQSVPGLPGDAESGDLFGWAVTAGDFDGDGFDDLAVGVIGEGADAGAVQTLYGSSTGLRISGSQLLTEDMIPIGGESEAQDWFGYALSSGDFNDDGYDDLAVGTPRESTLANAFVGSVSVLHGSPGGLVGVPFQYWTQTLLGLTAEDQERFGGALAAGDFNEDGLDDLAIGIVNDFVNGFQAAGSIIVLFGTIGGLDDTDYQFWTQDSPGLGETAESGELFGSALAAGDFDGNGTDDLAVGVYGEGVASLIDMGVTIVLPSSPSGLTADGARTWRQGADGVLDTPGEDRFGYALAAGDFDGNGDDELAVSAPLEDIEVVNNAGAVNVLVEPLAATDPHGQFLFQGSPIVVPNEQAVLEQSWATVLFAPAPNPFSSQTTLTYAVAEPSHVRLSVFDALGRRVAVLVDREQAAGRHEAVFNARALPGGTYLIRLETGALSTTRRLTLLR